MEKEIEKSTADRDKIEKIGKIIFADTIRFKIIFLLSKIYSEMSPRNIVGIIGGSTMNILHHISMLELDDIIKRRYKNSQILYSLNEDIKIAEVFDLLLETQILLDDIKNPKTKKN